MKKEKGLRTVNTGMEEEDTEDSLLHWTAFMGGWLGLWGFLLSFFTFLFFRGPDFLESFLMGRVLYKH